MFVIFSNPGVIDPRAIKTFGISAKLGQNPIGYFGTGLKYSIAILMRMGCEVEMQAGEDVFIFGKKPISQRGKDFEIVTMNDEELPFTTELGKNWGGWQAFRELYCNALDESGDVSLESKKPKPDPKSTRFIVRGSMIESAYAERHEIVLNLDKKLLLQDGPVKIYDRPSDYLYYRGVRVLKLDQPSIFTYNVIADQALTEDRTLVHDQYVTALLPCAISEMSSRKAIRKALLAPRDNLEGRLSYWRVESFLEKVGSDFYAVLADEFRRNNDSLNESARELQHKISKSSATKHYERADVTAVEQQQLDRAIGAIKETFPDFIDYKILIVKTLGQSTMALADYNEMTMVVSKMIFRLGTKYLTSTLIEEFLHLKTGYKDCTRELQTYLFDTLCTLIENHITKEPL